MKLRRLESHRIGGTRDRMQLGYAAPKTPGGRTYRLSPNQNAHPRHFLLGGVVVNIPLTDALRARMKHSPRTPDTVCPYSGTVAADSAFLHPDDTDAAVKLMSHDVIQDAHDAIADMLKDAFGGTSSSKSSFQITASLKPQRAQPRPHFLRNDLMRLLVCDHCGRDYGVFAIALFCPDCGAPNLRIHFLREAELVAAQVTLAEEMNDSQRELAFRLLGNAHEDVLTAFEATLKSAYLHGKLASGGETLPKVGNDFQNIARASKRFAELEIDPFAQIERHEMDALALNIQKRHVVGHNLGVVDDKFAAMAADAKIGETVTLVGADILQFAAISQKVIDSLDTWLGGSPSPNLNESPFNFMTEQQTIDPDDPHKLKGLDLDLSLLARKIGYWTAENCPDGHADHIDSDKFATEFAGYANDDITEAIAELSVDGFIETSGMSGVDTPSFRPRLDLYITFDGVVFARDPVADVAKLVEFILVFKEAVSAEDIFAKTEWDVRRFNPAFEYVAAQIPEDQVSRYYGTPFVTSRIHLMPDDRVRLKRMLRQITK